MLKFFILILKKKKKNISSILKKKNAFFFFFFFFKLSAIFGFVFIFFLIFSFSLENIPFFKLIFIWISFGFLMYILISGFNFFGKKYAYNRYNESLQRFWKRSFSIFWLLEGFIFAAFVYLTFNASSEVIYSYDPQVFFKTHLVSFRFFYFKLVLINLLLICFFSLTILNKLKTFNFFFFNITSAVVVILFILETSQFLSLLNHINFFEWSYNQSLEYSLDFEMRKSRIVNSYVFLLAGAKYLHVLFIVFVWFFNFAKSLENFESRDYIFSTCLQNTLILYFLNLISLYSVIKYFLRIYLLSSYTWFFVDFKNDFFLNIFNFGINLYKNFFFNFI